MCVVCSIFDNGKFNVEMGKMLIIINIIVVREHWCCVGHSSSVIASRGTYLSL